MSLKLGINIPSLNAQGNLGKAEKAVSSGFERLSSGLRINRASDDAAGLSVAMSLNTESRVLAQAARNINDGVSLLNAAESALNALSSITTRISELAEQAAKGTYSSAQRIALNSEAQALVSEFNRIVSATRYNGQSLFPVSGVQFSVQAGTGAANASTFNLGTNLTRDIGDGTFAAPISTVNGDANRPTGTYADVNGDGYEDIITGLSTLRVVLANGTGGFTGNISLFPGVSFV